MTRLADNTSFKPTVTDGKMSFDGLEITVKNGALANDSFTVKPVGDAIINMKVAVTDESKIAMAEVSKNDTDPNVDKGKSDNRNGQKLLDLQTKATIGNKTFNDEEYGNLQRYQQYYLANAQVLQTANSLFDALLNIR